MKLLGHRPGLPGNVKSFYIVPLDPASQRGACGARSGQADDILFSARGNRCCRFVASMDLDRDQTISDKRIPL